jgi:hypothetical protein
VVFFGIVIIIMAWLGCPKIVSLRFASSTRGQSLLSVDVFVSYGSRQQLATHVKNWLLLFIPIG